MFVIKIYIYIFYLLKASTLMMTCQWFCQKWLTAICFNKWACIKLSSLGPVFFCHFVITFFFFEKLLHNIKENLNIPIVMANNFINVYIGIFRLVRDIWPRTANKVRMSMLNKLLLVSWFKKWHLKIKKKRAPQFFPVKILTSDMSPVLGLLIFQTFLYSWDVNFDLK